MFLLALRGLRTVSRSLLEFSQVLTKPRGLTYSTFRPEETGKYPRHCLLFFLTHWSGCPTERVFSLITVAPRQVIDVLRSVLSLFPLGNFIPSLRTQTLTARLRFLPTAKL